MKRMICLFSLFIIGLFILVACVQEKGGNAAFPVKSITYSLPFEPGGQSDVEARRQQPYLEESLGQKIVIQYKPGGGGSVGWNELVNKNPDGYFVAGINIPHIILQPLVNEDSGYETEDIIPVAIFQATPVGIAVPKDSEMNTLDELVQRAKESPGSITAAGSGMYSGHHIALLELQDLTGMEMQYVPFDGAAPSLQAFLGGNTDVLFGNSNDLYQYRDEIKVLAIGSEETFDPLPDVPTFKEAGYDMTAGIDRGVGVPPGTAPEIIAILEKAFLDILDEPDVITTMYEEGFEPKWMGHQEALDYIQTKKKDYTRILGQLE